MQLTCNYGPRSLVCVLRAINVPGSWEYEKNSAKFGISWFPGSGDNRIVCIVELVGRTATSVIVKF